ncbi:restriction endonuclease subunit S [Haloarcula litorea]|uniref:restriction endonuclease subunit S n=1 Tax=Haloarcula litorea TaxID=3032579 RepID=UPI0023E834E4|nr:restriction endonuclease subunit S [Halomicroarcula sp. GDY20]
MKQEDLHTFMEEVQQVEEGEEYRPGNERWERRPLSELIEPVLGKTPKRGNDEFWEGGDIKWASAKDISQSKTRHVFETEDRMTEAGKEESNAKVMPEGTVVVTARGTVGEVVQLGEPMTYNQSCYGLATNDELLEDYLYYAWQYVFGQVQAVSYGTVFDTITMKSFKDIEIPVPPIEVQRLIADSLGQFDDKIEKNLDIAEDLESLTDAIFSDMISGESEEWTETEFGEIVEMYSGGPRKTTDKYTGGTHEWLTPTDVTDNGLSVINSTERKLNDLAFEETSVDLLPEDSVFLTSRATVGEVVVNKFPMAMNQGFIGLKPAEDIPPHFLAHLVKDKRAVIESRASGSTYPEISQRGFADIDVKLPPVEQREEFEEHSSSAYNLISSLLRENSLLRSTQEQLLPKMLSGAILPPG